MAKCKNDAFLKGFGQKKLRKKMEVDFDVIRDLPDCNKINVKNLVSGVENPNYNQYKIPKNQFECYRQGCINSGTLYVGTAETKYRLHGDTTEFAAGVITFYAIAPAGATATVKIGEAEALTNANVYTVTLDNVPTGGDGFKAVAIDLSQAPSSTAGEGWTPGENGAYISIALSGTGVTEANAAISSIAIFDEIEDFATSSVVKVACLSSIEGDFGLEAAEATCFHPGRYQTEDITFERTIAGASVTPNYIKLNPLAKRNDKTEEFDIETVQKTVVARDGYGAITLTDLDQDQCGYIGVQLADVCIASDAMLTRLTIPSAMALGANHFVAVDNGDGSTTLLFNEIHVGASVLVSYPKKVNAESYDISADNLDGVSTRMTYAREYTDGTKWRFVFDNVLVTSFPDALSEDDDADFEFTISIQRGKDGRFGRAYRILD